MTKWKISCRRPPLPAPADCLLVCSRAPRRNNSERNFRSPVARSPAQGGIRGQWVSGSHAIGLEAGSVNARSLKTIRQLPRPLLSQLLQSHFIAFAVCISLDHDLVIRITRN